MPDTINNNPGNNQGSSSTAWILGLAVVVLLVLFLIFLWPTLANKDAVTDTSNEDTTGDTNSLIPPSVTNNTIINATTTVNNSTTTPR